MQLSLQLGHEHDTLLLSEEMAVVISKRIVFLDILDNAFLERYEVMCITQDGALRDVNGQVFECTCMLQLLL